MIPRSLSKSEAIRTPIYDIIVDQRINCIFIMIYRFYFFDRKILMIFELKMKKYI